MKKAKIYYYKVDDSLTRQQKLNFLREKQDITHIEWQEITPDKKHNWLTDDLQADFETFIPLGSKEAKAAKILDTQTIFKNYGLGVTTSRDDWMFSFNKDKLAENIKILIHNYNSEVNRYQESNNNEIINIDQFINNDPSYIKWTDRLKKALSKYKKLEFDESLIRHAIYRPFVKQFLYFEDLLCHRRYQFPQILPTTETEQENQVISVTNHTQLPFVVQITNYIPCLDVGGRPTQCFPFYTYNQDGTNRQENITDWALNQYQNYYQDNNITKWNIFYYIYAILHHPVYRKRYQANLKKDLPRIPFAPEFKPFAIAGKQLADLHLNYENQPEYPLTFIENNDLPLNWRVEKMKLTKDKSTIIYNEFLTLENIPKEVFQYKLGNKSALDWIIDQYQVKTDKKSGLLNDPNRLDDEQYIAKLIGKIITVSLETIKIINNLPDCLI